MALATCPICREVKDLKDCEIHEDYPGRYPCKGCLRLSRQERNARVRAVTSLSSELFAEGEEALF